jgi:hypothetical protein
MNSNDKVKKLDQKVLFIRVSEDIYSQIEELAKAEERSINWMSTHLLKSALEKKNKDPKTESN